MRTHAQLRRANYAARRNSKKIGKEGAKGLVLFHFLKVDNALVTLPSCKSGNLSVRLYYTVTKPLRKIVPYINDLHILTKDLIA